MQPSSEPAAAQRGVQCRSSRSRRRTRKSSSTSSSHFLLLLLFLCCVEEVFSMVVVLPGLAAVPGTYDAYIVDQWGVMHDGRQAYPGAVDCIRDIHASGARIVLLSNSSKRSAKGLENLRRMGFDPDHFVGVVTSGELAWQSLKAGNMPPFSSLGRRVFVIGSGEEDFDYITSAGLEPSPPESCDFVLVRGMFGMLESRGGEWSTTSLQPHAVESEQAQKALEVCLARGRPLLVTNPDYLRPGTNDPMPGLIGRSYAQRGGVVHYVGKPHQQVYEDCYKLLQDAGCGLKKLCAVGDSLSHDILGASRANMDSIFIASGVHSEELGIPQGSDSAPSADRLGDLFARIAATEEAFRPPTYTVASFKS